MNAAGSGTAGGAASGPPAFGELLREWRTRAGFSQESLAERAQVSLAAVGALEQGSRRAPYRHTVRRLADALGLSTAEHTLLEQTANRARLRSTKPNPSQLGESKTNVPAPLTSFIARDEVSQIAALVERHRLVTITGSGGMGKTRTALEVARQRPRDCGDTWLIDLAALRDGDMVAGEMAAVLRLPLDQLEHPLEAVLRYLKGRRTLLLVDNCEHLVGPVAGIIGALLQACPRLTVLATSRERLGLSGEVLFRLPSLTLPGGPIRSIDQPQSYSALALFVARAQAADAHWSFNVPRLEVASDICRRLEGIPLAIELAVSHLPSLGLDALRARLDQNFTPVGGRDLPQRHKTMVATIAWSYDLLDPGERTLLRRLSVFAGGFRLRAAELVCADEVLASTTIAPALSALVQKSLLNVAHARDSTRYVLLDSIRAFAAERLSEAHEADQLGERHARWLAELGDELDANPGGSGVLAALPELENARAAIRWSLTSNRAAHAVLAGRIAGGLRRIWYAGGRHAELFRWVEAILPRIDEADQPRIAARLLRVLVHQEPGAAVLAAAERALPLCERCGDRAAAAAIRMHLSASLCKRGDFDRAEHELTEAVEFFGRQQPADARRHSTTLATRAWVRGARGDIDGGRSDIAAALARLNDAHETHGQVRSNVIVVLAEIEFAAGDWQRAAELCEGLLDGAGTDGLSRRMAIHLLKNVASCRLVLGEIDAAQSAAKEALHLARDLSLWDGPESLLHYATVLALRGRADFAATLLGVVDACYARDAFVMLPIERPSYDALTTALRAQLAAPEIAAFHAVGVQLTLAEVTDRILVDDERQGG